MGLDINAYSGCRFVHPGPWVEACEDEDHIAIYAPHPSHALRLDGRDAGCYLSDGKSLRFQAGSYGGYGDWRRHLCQTVLGVPPYAVWADRDTYVGLPFVELIDFSDCEGAIGPETSAKLAEDFSRTVDAPEDFGWFVGKYEAWRDAFSLARDGGFVVFH